MVPQFVASVFSGTEYMPSFIWIWICANGRRGAIFVQDGGSRDKMLRVANKTTQLQRIETHRRKQFSTMASLHCWEVSTVYHTYTHSYFALANSPHSDSRPVACGGGILLATLQLQRSLRACGETRGPSL